ncbi:MAG TPA: hypothetical protein VIH91_08280 [Terriglobales bacterium]
MSENLSPACSPRLSLAVAALLLALFLGSAFGQTVSQPTDPPKPVPGIGTTVQDQAAPHSSPQGQPAPPPESQKPITKAQAKELFRSVDEILKFVSQDTGLPIKHKVKRKLITRANVKNYVEKRLKDDKDTQRLERSQLVLKKFGMIPADYDLHSEFLKLLSEQVAAYYDSKTKTVNLLDWVKPELQKTVLSHELTHALQDQAVDLEKWGMAGAKDDLPLPDQQEQVVEEAQPARQNVVEGQAMVAMLDYTLAPAGLNILTAPDVVNAMRAAMTDGKDSPVMASAPVFLRESLLMPYTFGLDFVREVLSKKGRTAAFGGMLEHPPIDTRQVMQPDTYIAGQPVEPPTIPDLDKLIAPDYQRYDFGGMGAFDIYLLAKQYAPDTDAKSYYSHWRGGYYLAAHAKSAPKDQLALMYFSRWDSPEAAISFAKLYNSYVPKRYTGSVGLVGGGLVGGDTSSDIMFSWDFEKQGKVVIQTCATDVLVLEGFDDPTANRIRAALLNNSQQPAAPSAAAKP